MTDATVFRLEQQIRETCAFRVATDPPDADAHAHLMARLAAIRERIPRDEALRLEVLIERVTGVRVTHWTGRD